MTNILMRWLEQIFKMTTDIGVKEQNKIHEFGYLMKH